VTKCRHAIRLSELVTHHITLHFTVQKHTAYYTSSTIHEQISSLVSILDIIPDKPLSY